ncbi:MAG TPA: TonB family protein [Terriglobales bacterium]|nr:TonB family protein [Terriglobales bacterium]
MFPQPMSRSEFRSDDSHLDLTRLLEQHLLAGFPPDLALDLVLNELVVRAADATGASSAALALFRGEEMVCRAATGPVAPDLGIPLNTRDGLSGACLQTRRPQRSADTELDPLVDSAIAQRLGIRSILIVPVFDSVSDSHDKNAQVSGVLEAFSTSPAAFSNFHQDLLEGFAEECARIRRAATELSQSMTARADVPGIVLPETVLAKPVLSKPAPPASGRSALIPSNDIAGGPLPTRRPPYQTWTLILGTLAIFVALAVSFIIGSRIGWLLPSASHTQTAPTPTNSQPDQSTKSAAATKSAETKTKAAAPASDELVVYEKGKVIFRMKPAAPKPDRAQHQAANPDATKQSSDAIVEASSATKIAPFQSVWLSPAQAETRLLSRTEPQYPPEALAARRAGNVVLEVQVAEDGSVSNIRTLSGDPTLAAAATEAVRNWRYQPYRNHDRPATFQTDVTLGFVLPN